jgi:hypothetical protein
MKLQRLIVVGMCMATLGAVSMPMTASAQVVVYYNSAPPSARYEAVPAPRRGYEWSPGYWNVKGKKHVWQNGHWERNRSGYHYAQPSWTQHNNQWQLQRGQWEKGDRDHDGVSNAVDRAPDNPTRQ